MNHNLLVYSRLTKQAACIKKSASCQHTRFYFWYITYLAMLAYAHKWTFHAEQIRNTLNKSWPRVTRRQTTAEVDTDKSIDLFERLNFEEKHLNII